MNARQVAIRRDERIFVVPNEIDGNRSQFVDLNRGQMCSMERDTRVVVAHFGDEFRLGRVGWIDRPDVAEKDAYLN